MRIIAIESAGPALGLAAVETGDDKRPVDQEETMELDTALRHTESLVPALTSLMERVGWVPDSIGAVLVGSGPGSFTGLRVGMAAAKGIALAANCPVVSVDTLEAYAETWRASSPPREAESSPPLIVSVIDARKGRLYTAFFMEEPASDTTAALTRISGNMDLEPEALTTRIEAALERDTRLAGWVHAHASPTAITGVVRLGLRALAAGEMDDAWKGPAYLRESDVGEPRRYPRFSSD